MSSSTWDVARFGSLDPRYRLTSTPSHCWARLDITLAYALGFRRIHAISSKYCYLVELDFLEFNSRDTCLKTFIFQLVRGQLRSLTNC